MLAVDAYPLVCEPIRSAPAQQSRQNLPKMYTIGATLILGMVVPVLAAPAPAGEHMAQRGISKRGFPGQLHKWGLSWNKNNNLNIEQYLDNNGQSVDCISPLTQLELTSYASRLVLQLGN